MELRRRNTRQRPHITQEHVKFNKELYPLVNTTTYPPQDRALNATIKHSSKPRVSMKTVSQGMMDVSLLTSNASQLRTVLLHPKSDFYWLLISMILVSMALQVFARVIMLWSDYLKDPDCKQSGNKRKQIQFVALVIMSFITVTNTFISAFSITPHDIYINKT